MSDKKNQREEEAVDINALEADVAFFDARISLAARQHDTAYQKAQKKTYELLCEVMSSNLEKLRKKSKS